MIRWKERAMFEGERFTAGYWLITTETGFLEIAKPPRMAGALLLQMNRI